MVLSRPASVISPCASLASSSVSSTSAPASPLKDSTTLGSSLRETIRRRGILVVSFLETQSDAAYRAFFSPPTWRFGKPCRIQVEGEFTESYGKLAGNTRLGKVIGDSNNPVSKDQKLFLFCSLNVSHQAAGAISPG